METYEVTIMNLKTKEEKILLIEADEAESSDDIVLKTVILEREFCSSNYNDLSAYQELRDKILELGYGIKCNGSRINVVQSGMMGASDKIYLVEFGRQALMKDVVGIFDYAEINEFPNSLQQNEYSMKWFDSLN